MSAPVRRSFGIATLLSVVLAMLIAPVGLGYSDGSTSVEGIDVDTTTIPELQALMDAGRLTSAQLPSSTSTG